MKRLITFVLAVMMLASVFVMTALAVEESTPSIMADLAGLMIDGEKFNEANYPKDTSRSDVEFLAVAEKGFRTISSSDNYGLYIYVYNPSCIAFESSEKNSVQIGLNYDADVYSYYGLSLCSRSEDYRFLKYKVTSYGQNLASELYKLQGKASERVYNIPAIRLTKDGELATYMIGLAYIFSGYDSNSTLSCSVRDCEVIEVELHATSWISPNAGSTISGDNADMYDHYEVHSVYFTLDKSYLDTYEYISSFRAGYNAMKLTPIIVSREGKLTEATVNAIKNAENVGTTGTEVNELVAVKYALWMSLLIEQTYSEWYWSDVGLPITSGARYDRLAYYFENNDLPEDFDMEGVYSVLGFTSEELEDYYDKCIDKGIDPSALISESTGYKMIEYDYKNVYCFKTYTEDLSGIAKWWHDISTKDDTYLNDTFVTEMKRIEVITDPSQYSTEAKCAGKSNSLFINECDLPAFASVCADAASNDQVVVVFRYGVSDYRSLPLYDVWELGALQGTWSDPVAIGIEKWAYTDVSVAQIGFTTAGVETIVPTVSNTVDSFGDGYVYEDPIDQNGILPGDSNEDWWEELLAKIKEMMQVIMFVFLGVAILAVVVIVVVPSVQALTTAGTSRRVRKMEKQLKKQDQKKE